ncbi:MAG: putative metal-binding motif-containing protein [Deltaproteobacteria bacterium]|nr:putative metal-binding motif-containing protein [Deltaproteobacteria bacterium]
MKPAVSCLIALALAASCGGKSGPGPVLDALPGDEVLTGETAGGDDPTTPESPEPIPEPFDAPQDPGAPEATDAPADPPSDAGPDSPGSPDSLFPDAPPGECTPEACKVWFKDGDGDGYGDESDSRCLCAADAPYTAEAGEDCDDADADVRPGGQAKCGKDGDCDGSPADPGEACDDGNATDWDGCTGCAPSEFRVNTATADWQRAGMAAVAPDGRTLMAWLSMAETEEPQETWPARLWVKGFGPDLSVAKEEFRLGQDKPVSRRPDCTATADGRFVVAWGYSGIGPDAYIAIRRLGSDFEPDGPESALPREQDEWQMDPAVVSLLDGGIVVGWSTFKGLPVPEDPDVTSRDHDILATFVSGDGSYAPPFRLNSVTPFLQWTPRLAGLTGGGFVAVWTTYGVHDPVGSSLKYPDVHGRCFGADGQATSPEFEVNEVFEGNQQDPTVAALSDGGFVVGWTDKQGPKPAKSFARRYGPQCTPSGPAIEFVSEEPHSKHWVQVAGSGDGRFAVAWFDKNKGVPLQVFGPDGEPLGVPSVANVHPGGGKTVTDLVPMPGGDLLVVWEGGTWGELDGDGTGVYARRVSWDWPGGP